MHFNNSATCFHIRNKDTRRFLLAALWCEQSWNFLLLMKTLFLSGAAVAILGLAVAPMLAQTTQSTTVQTSKLIGTKVKSSQGEEIGVIKDVVLDRNTGCMAYTVLSTGGAGTRVTGGGKMVAVPWRVYSPTADLNVLTVTADRERIYSAPVFDYARIDEYSSPAYINNVYSYYGVSPGAGIGVGVSGTTTTTGGTTTAGAAGATAGPGATASPAATFSPATTASPGATRSPAATASPTGRASPSPYATAAASPRGTATATPYATASPSPRGAGTASPPARGTGGARGRPEATTSPSRGGETATSPITEGSPSEAASPGERTKPSRHHGKQGKTETATPSERPEEQE
jgi:sporulation protein YlmC with PRC-barrel domain